MGGRPRPPPGDAQPLPVLRVPPGRSLFGITRFGYPDAAIFTRPAAYRFTAVDQGIGGRVLGISLASCLVDALAPS